MDILQIEFFRTFTYHRHILRFQDISDEFANLFLIVLFFFSSNYDRICNMVSLNPIRPGVFFSRSGPIPYDDCAVLCVFRK
jgi:hypothetical protein